MCTVLCNVHTYVHFPNFSLRVTFFVCLFILFPKLAVSCLTKPAPPPSDKLGGETRKNPALKPCFLGKLAVFLAGLGYLGCSFCPTLHL